MSDDLLYCGCGKSMDKKRISAHFNSCTIMKKKYAKLFQQIDREITQESKHLSDWENLKVMFDFLSSHITMMINKERRNPSKFKS